MSDIYQDQAITPYRTTTAYFDIDETVLIDESWSVRRDGPNVSKLAAKNLADDANRVNVRFWPSSGAWTLEPVQSDIGKIHEYVDVLSLVIPASGFRLLQDTAGAAQIAAVLNWRQASDLPGQAFSTAIAAQGDQFLVKTMAANKAGVPLASGVTVPPQTTIDVPLDRCGESTTVFPADQGYCLRWSAPGNGQSYNTYLWSFYFGQYALSMRGNGTAILWENCHDSAGVLQWRKRAQFQYQRPSNIGDASQSICIWPHKTPKGERYIAFFGNLLEIGNVVAAEAKTGNDSITGTEFLYRITDLVRGDDRDESPGTVTRADVCRFDMRRDLRIRLQVSKLGFATSGTLVDLPEALPPQTGGAPISVAINAVQPTGTSITTSLEEATTRAAFNPATDLQPYVTFNFSGDGSTTPILWGYSMERAPFTQTISPGEFHGKVTSFSGTGVDLDVSHEAAKVTIEDITNTASRLRKRGELTNKIVVTESIPSLPVKSTVVIQGRAYRQTSQRQGKTRGQGFGGGGDPLLFPDPTWNEFDVPIFGMWARLHERVQEPLAMTKYADDTQPTPHGHNAAKINGVPPPWKVTDAITDLLLKCGFPASQIGIQDNPKRLWPSNTGNVPEYAIYPCVNLAETVQRMARNYLGAYLFFDANAGTLGKWRLLYPPQADITTGLYTPLWNFTSVPPSGKIPHMPGAYPAKTSFAIEGKRYTAPPDFNSVRVIAAWGPRSSDVRIENTLYNPLSYNVPGFTVTADPDNPHYIGHNRPCILIDYTLNGKDEQETQRAVDWTCIRLFTFLCFAQDVQPLHGPLPMIDDPDNTGKYRFLRSQDPITYNGQPFVLRNVNPAWVDDKQQMADYEAVQPIPM